MTKKYYECHITIMGDASVVRPIVEETGWTFSCIDGDPVLGAGIKCYATRQINADKYEFEQVRDNVLAFGNIYRRKNLNVIREKVELVIFDKRSNGD